MIVYASVDIELEDEICKLSVTDRWSLLQLLWDDLEKNGSEKDWESFWADNPLPAGRKEEPPR